MRTVTVVLIGALASSARALDALNVRRWLDGEAPLRVAQQSVPRVRASTRKVRAVRVVRASLAEPVAL